MSSPASHDFHFCFDVPHALENDRVKLVPFIPSIHAQPFFAATQPHPELFQNGAWGPFPDAKSFEELIEPTFGKDPGWILFAVFDKTMSPSGTDEDCVGTMVGTMGYINSSPTHLSTEIGAVIVFPPFQRTHIASNAVGLLLNYALNLPTHPSFPGLGLRRVVWQANYLNTSSVRLAQRMGFQMEGILKWDKVLPKGKGLAVANGKGWRDGDPRAGCLGRDTAMLSVCWDDWEGGGREKVQTVMMRTG